MKSGTVRMLSALTILIGASIATDGLAAQTPAPIIFPSNGQTDVGWQARIEWESVPDALAYYLYVGSTPGAKDIVDTGEIQALSYPVIGLPAGQQLHARLYTKFASAWQFVDVSFSLVAPAQFISPLDGNSEFDARGDVISWTAVPGAQAYYLYLGSEPGAKDLLDSRETLATSLTTTALPAGKTVFATIHTKRDERWRKSSIQFRTAPIAYITSPSPSSELDARTGVISWSEVAGAEAYYLDLGTAPGLKDILDTGELQATSIEVKNLPPGVKLYARLHTKHGGQWRSVDATIATRPVAYFTQPAVENAEVDVRDDRISWTAVPGAQAYYLYLGSQPGAKDLLDSRETVATSIAATSLPVGKVVYARLFTKFDDRWRYVDTVFSTRPVAYITTPAPPSSELDARTGVIGWTEVAGAEAYYLYLGTQPGLKDLIDTGELQTTSIPVTKLPVGVTLYARLHTKHGGRWRAVDSTITTRPVAYFTQPLFANAELDVRADRIAWTDVPGAQAYYLYLGSEPGAKDLLDSRETLANSLEIAALPVGKTVYARLFTKSGDRWRFVDTVFLTRPVAYFTNVFDGMTGVDVRQSLEWTAVDGAEAYFLYIGSSPGASDLLYSSEIHTTSRSISRLPGGARVYATLFTKWGGKWRSVSASFTTRPESHVFSPSLGSTIRSFENGFFWNPSQAATAYRLEIGSSQGESDLFDSGVLSESEVQVPALPGATTIHVRLWTLVDGEWIFSDTTYRTGASPALVNPRLGAYGVSQSITIQWTPVQGADTYDLNLGSTVGGRQYFSSGPLQQTEVAVSGLPPDALIFVRVRARTSNTWAVTDSVFSTLATPPGAAILSPMDVGGQLQLDPRHGFEWTQQPLARSYSLQIGSQPGTSDFLQLDDLLVTRRLVRNLPTGVPLYGRLVTRFYDGSEVSQNFEFRVAEGALTLGDQIAAAHSAVSYVREMADQSNRPMPTSLLARLIDPNGWTGAFCTTYSQALVEALTQMAVGLQVRYLNICLNPHNNFDCHTLVEAFNPEQSEWMLLDPTFGMTIRRAGSEEWAAAEDVRNSTLAFDWSGLEFEFLAPDGDAFARAYYLDYPLLYMNILAPDGSGLLYDEPDSIAAYFEPTNDFAGPGVYAVQCPEGQSSTVLALGGVPTEISCSGNDRLSHVFSAPGIAAIDPDDAPVVLVPKRFLFPLP